MNRYEVLERLGDGSFGEVVKARSIKTNEVVAIKKIKALFPTWEECLQLRELKSLRVLRHDNVVQLKEVIRDKEELYFVFEYMQTSLFKVMRDLPRHHTPPPTIADCEDNKTTSESQSPPPGWLTEPQIKSIMFQLFSGLAYMHKHGFFHRDIKPENLLCHEETLKIADLGQAREIRSRPPFTDYVSTRWYRSPELLLRSKTYNSPIDLWACGCIMAELYLQTPLFMGNSEADQLCRICKVLGTPTKDTWPEGITLVSQLAQFKFPKCPIVPWKNVLPSYISKSALLLISELLQYDPSKRPTAVMALQHRFFDQQVTRPMLTQSNPPPHSQSLKAEHKAYNGGKACSVAGSKKDSDDNAWWRNSTTTVSSLPATASHSDVLASIRAAGTNREGAILRADSKSCGDSNGSWQHPLSKKGSHNESGSNWIAQKWSTPEQDDEYTTISERKQEMDYESQEKYGRSSPPMSSRSRDTMLQELLDEFL